MNRTRIPAIAAAAASCFLALAFPAPPALSQQKGDPGDGGAADSPAPPEEESGFEQIELFTRVVEMIRQNYADPEKATYENLINSALEGMLADLDPHCQFMQPRVFEQMKKNTGSTYEGVGITIANRNEVLTIVTVREDGPAARSGVLPGDQILKINDILTEDVGMTEAINLLRGKPGETLKLTVRRPATRELKEFEMVREIIKQSTVKDVRILDEKSTSPYRIGYARLLQFSQPSHQEIADALDELEKKGMDAFVLDLRNNPGGLLSSAINICGEFVKAGTVVLTTEGKPGSGQVKVYRTTAKAKRRDRDYPLAILVNHSSASGSEVVAGALQDLKRCIVVGETSFGKGSVQTILPLDGSGGKAIRMTTAKYYTPSHRTIHENGVIPNIVATLTPAEERQLFDWFNRENLQPEARKRAEKFRDPQLIRAVDAMIGALVYSGRNEPDKPEEGGGKEEPAVAGKGKPEPGEEPPAETESGPAGGEN